MQIEEVKEHLRKFGYTVSAHSADGTYYFSNVSEANRPRTNTNSY